MDGTPKPPPTATVASGGSGYVTTHNTFEVCGNKEPASVVSADGSTATASGPATARYGALLLRELQFAVAGDHLDAIARFEFAAEEFRGQRVQQAVLDSPLDRAGAELRVETFLGNQLLG